MIKIETHCHIQGFSTCGDGNSQLTVEKYKQNGYGGIIITNHHSKFCYENFYQGQTDKEKIDYFFKLNDQFSSLCAKSGIKTFLGLEVRCLPTKTEYMILGFDRQFFYDNPLLFNLSQQELFELADKNGLFMYQTHPFREGVVAGDPKFMHGAESFNGHYHHINNNDIALKFCKDNNLIGLSGTDYHHDDQPITAGMYLPKNINDDKSLVKYLFENKFTNIENPTLYEQSLKKYKE